MNILKWVNGGHQRSYEFLPSQCFRSKTKYSTGKMRSVRSVDAESPKMIAHARPSQTGSLTIVSEPNMAASDVRTIGSNRIRPASTSASCIGRPDSLSGSRYSR